MAVTLATLLYWLLCGIYFCLSLVVGTVQAAVFFALEYPLLRFGLAIINLRKAITAAKGANNG